MKLVFTILACFFLQQISAQNQFTITGNIDSIKNGYIWLNIFYPDAGTIDTVPIINGSYKFTGKINRPYKARLDIADGKPDYCDFIIEPKIITVKGKGYPLKNWKVTGSVANEEDKKLKQFLTSNDKQFDKLDSLRKITKDDDSISIAKIDNEWGKLTEERINLQKKFIAKYPSFSRSAMLLEQMFVYGMVEKEFPVLYKNLSPLIKKSAIGKDLANYLSIQESIYPAEIKQKDTLGNIIALSSLRGKYVLIDFWASWCIPCREENPSLVKLYNKFKSSELEFLSVSYDENLEKWKTAIVEDGLNWLHVSELNRWGNSTSKNYNIFSIPQNVLINKDGKRIGKNLNNGELEKVFESLFPEK